MTKTADVLDRAAEELDIHGWKRYARGENDGPKCAIGAISFVVTGATYSPVSGLSKRKAAAFDEALDAVRKDPLLKHESLGNFNDHVASDKRTITRLLRRTARRLRNEN